MTTIRRQRPGDECRIRCEYDKVPDKAFMIVVFDRERVRGMEGVARERPEFAAAM